MTADSSSADPLEAVRKAALADRAVPSEADRMAASADRMGCRKDCRSGKAVWKGRDVLRR